MWWILGCVSPWRVGVEHAPAPVPRHVAAIIEEPLWIDPSFDQSFARATVWFDRQLLADATAYPRFVEAHYGADRRALRAQVVETLRETSLASWTEAAPAIDALVQAGVLAACRRHWIINGFSCDLPFGDPAPLATIPGVRLVFRVPAPESPARPAEAAGPTDVTDRPVAPPFDPAAASTWWNLARMRFPEAWARATGRGVRIALHDDGFALDLPAISGTVWRNEGEIPRNGVDDEGDGYVDDVHGFAFDRGDAHIEYVVPRPNRPVHGTLIAATVAGRAADGRTLGGAPDARWMGLTANEIEEPIEWALDHGADIYSMSFSLPGFGDTRAHWRKVMEHAACSGLFLVSGAGNFGDPRAETGEPLPVQLRIPEDVPLAVFAVSGIGWNGLRPPFSSQGPVSWDVVHYRQGLVDKPDFATVNNDAPALWPDGSVRVGRGNSFAAPHLSAVLALMLEVDPDLTPWRARDLLIGSALDLGAPGFDPEYGFGFVDAATALATLDE